MSGPCSALIIRDKPGSLLPLQTAVPVVGDARDDWKILRALSEVLGVTLPVERCVHGWGGTPWHCSSFVALCALS